MASSALGRIGRSPCFAIRVIDGETRPPLESRSLAVGRSMRCTHDVREGCRPTRLAPADRGASSHSFGTVVVLTQPSIGYGPDGDRTCHGRRCTPQTGKGSRMIEQCRLDQRAVTAPIVGATKLTHTSRRRGCGDAVEALAGREHSRLLLSSWSTHDARAYPNLSRDLSPRHFRAAEFWLDQSLLTSSSTSSGREVLDGQ